MNNIFVCLYYLILSNNKLRYLHDNMHFLKDLFYWLLQALSKRHYGGRRIYFYKHNFITIQKKRTISSSIALIAIIHGYFFKT